MNLFTGLKRRHVFRIGIAYLVVAWLVVQVVAAVTPMLDLPVWLGKTVLILLAAGFPIALLLTWGFELTPEGVKRTDAVSAMPQAVGEPKPAIPAADSSTPSIAVLPFADMSPNKDHEYFADGITEELLNKLARLRGLQVAGRTSSFHFKGKNEDMRLIGEALSVANVLEGSVRKSGDRVRITAQLINARTGYHLWSETYDRKLDDIFAIQDDISKSVATALSITLGVGELGQMAGGTRNAKAYDEYLQGQSLVFQRQLDASSQAIDHFETAINLDPSFSWAWLGIANASGMATIVDTPDHIGDWNKRKQEAFARAKKFAPDSLPVILYAAQENLHRNQWIETESALQNIAGRGAKLPPQVDFVYGRFLLAVGRTKEAIDYLRRFQRAEPLSPFAYGYLGGAYAASGNLSEALKVHETGLEKVGDLPHAPLAEMSVLTALQANDRGLILKRLDAAIAIDPVLAPIQSAMRPLLDDKPAALAALHGMLKDPSASNSLQRLYIAMWAAYFGDASLSLDALRTEKDFLGIYPEWANPMLRDVRKLPGFKDLMRSAGLVDYWRKTGHWADICHPIGDDDFDCS